MREISFLPPLLLLKGQKPLDVMNEALQSQSVIVQEREFEEGVYTDVPYRKIPEIVGHRYTLDTRKRRLIVEPKEGMEYSSPLVTNEGNLLRGDRRLVVKLSERQKRRRRLLGVTTAIGDDAFYLLSLLELNAADDNPTPR